ncbi:MAG: fibrobacter succinogenes major paralogous domain-containing protein [Candidatus Marinimicrobia bacterium]|nr:fibrobacter succinogenes major paralogous domain-containing protein [Candidatus Neomarinimicrobiota bacterium]
MIRYITILTSLLFLTCDYFDSPSEPKDCAGTPGGSAYVDNCGNCDDDPTNDCHADCHGIWGGEAIVDDCEVCTGGITGLEFNSDLDCTGECFGEAVENECGCVEGTTGFEPDWCYGCTDPTAPNYNPMMLIDDGSCAYGQCVDIEGNVYETVIIGDQEWMAENLKVTRYRNGDQIPTGFTFQEWALLYETETGAYSVYNDDPSMSEIYGNLYNFFVINDDRGCCPVGWHVASDEEYMELEIFLGMPWHQADNEGMRGTDEGGKLKQDGTTHWLPPNTGATNESGFTALPSGYRSANNLDNFEGIDYTFYVWTSSVGPPYHMGEEGGWIRKLYSESSQINRWVLWKGTGFSVRCIKD